jgi:hypothetical protein
MGRQGTALCVKEDALTFIPNAQAPRRAASPRSLRGPTSLVDGLRRSRLLVPEHDVAAALGPNSAVCRGAKCYARAGRSKIRASPAQPRPHPQYQSPAIRPNHVASLEVRASPGCDIVTMDR